MKLQRLYSLTRQAIDHYHLIEDGDPAVKTASLYYMPYRD